MGEKERFEVLLEEVRDDVRTVAEGLAVLRQEMERGFESLYQGLHSEIAELRSDFKFFVKHTDRLVALETKQR